MNAGPKADGPPFPVRLDRDRQSRCLVIEWSDDLRQKIAWRTLRDRCPCAACRTPPEESGTGTPGGLNILTSAETLPLEIVSMKPVGNYAYHIEFSDGHHTGIYTFDLLRSLEDPDR